MNTQTQRHLAGACLFVAALVLAPQPQAKAAPLLELVPPDAAMAVYMPSYAQFEARIDGFAESMALPMPKMSEMRQMFGVGVGLNLQGPVGMIFLDLDFDAMNGEDPNMVLIATFTDYDALIKGMGGEPEAGVTRITMPMGEPGYAKRLTGSFFALAPYRETLEQFRPDTNVGRERLKKMPPGVLATVEKNAAGVLIYDLAPMLKAYEQAMQMAAMMGGMGMGQQETEQQQALMDMAGQVDVLALGMDVGQLGLSLSMAAGFKDGTEMHKAAKKARAAAPLLRHAPAGDYLFVMGVDGSALQMLKPLQALAGQQQPGTDFAWAMLEEMTGQETAIYLPPAGLFGGLLTKGVTISYAKDPKKAYRLAADAIQEMDGTAEDGMRITTTFTPDALEIAGHKAARYGFNFVFPPDMAGAGQAMTMMFGGPGPRGFMIETKNAVVQTMGTDQTFTAQVLRSLAGETRESIAADRQIQSIGRMLPADRVAEGYVGVGSAAKMVVPMAAMFLGAPIEVPDDMAPIGFGVTVGDGEMGGTAFIPMQLMISVKEMIETMQAQFEDDWDDWDDDWDDDDDDWPF